MLAPAGTLETISEPDTTVNGAGVPLKRTVLDPVKFVPSILTIPPTLPKSGSVSTKGPKPAAKAEHRPQIDRHAGHHPALNRGAVKPSVSILDEPGFRVRAICTIVLGSCTDGGGPESALVEATDGAFYGTTYDGGANCSGDVGGCGTIFGITASGKLTTVYRFCSQIGCPDGANPEAELIQATDGELYGTTYNGGINCPDIGGCGTIFRLNLGGDFSTLYTFCEANAALRSIVRREDGQGYDDFLKGLAKQSGIETPTREQLAKLDVIHTGRNEYPATPGIVIHEPRNMQSKERSDSAVCSAITDAPHE